MTYLPILLIIVVFYFLLIRPQQKRAKEARELQNNLQTGTKVMLTSGIIGEVAEITEDNHVKIEIAEGTVITVVRQAVAQVLPEPSEDSEQTDEQTGEQTDGQTDEDAGEQTHETTASDEPTQDPGVIVDLGKKDSSN